MEKQQPASDVSRLIVHAMRPFDALPEEAASRGGAPGGSHKPTSGLGRSFERLRSLLGETDLLLNFICVLFAAGFFALAVMNISLAGNFFTIDGLFFTAVCLMLAGIFLVSPLLMMKERGWLRRPAFAGAGDVEIVEDETIHFEGSTRLFMSILGWLLALTLIEVVLAYIHFDLRLMLTILIGLSLIKAALIMAYFMHLRFERLSLVLTLVPILVVCICLLLVFFPDSLRALNLRSTRASATENR